MDVDWRDDPLPIPSPRPRRTISATIAEIVLGLIAFPATFVGLTLIWGAVSLGSFTEHWPVPVAFTAYGAATLIAFLAERRASRWALAATLGSQLPWIAGMLWAYATMASDWSLLVAVALAVAAIAASVLAHLSRARRA